MSQDVRRSFQQERGPALPVEPELQQLLGQANLEYGAPRDEVAAFRRLTLALERRRPERGLRPWLWVFAGVGAVALAGILVQGQLLQGSVATLRLAPEPPVVASAPREVVRRAERGASGESEAALGRPAQEGAAQEGAAQSARATDVPNDVPALEPLRAPLLRDDEAARRPRRTAVMAPVAPSAAPKVASSVASSAAPAVPPSVTQESLGEDCLALARDGRPRPAERCFERRSQGTGLSAEMALYELARLRRDVLGDTEGALGALWDYRQRFPAGSLRNEVDVSRIELLARLGRGQEALSASERLLATPAGRERAAELRLLRGNVYRSAGSLREAIGEYASAERLGGSLGEEATFLRAQCLEALGDVAAARQAYGRSAQSTGSRRNEAQARLAALQRSTP